MNYDDFKIVKDINIPSIDETICIKYFLKEINIFYKDILLTLIAFVELYL